MKKCFYVNAKEPDNIHVSYDCQHECTCATVVDCSTCKNNKNNEKILGFWNDFGNNVCWHCSHANIIQNK